MLTGGLGRIWQVVSRRDKGGTEKAKKPSEQQKLQKKRDF